MTVNQEGIAYRTAGFNGQPLVTQPTLVSGTAQVFYSDRDCVAYVEITGGSAGTTEVQIISPSGTTTMMANTLASAAADSQLLTIKLPAGFALKITVSVATITLCTVITD